MTAERKAVDWEAIEREYRAGQLSIREIGRSLGVTDTAIRKKAKAEGWQRDLTDRVKEAVRAKLVRDLGSQEGSHEQRAQTEREIVETTAQRGVELVRSHQKSLARGNKIVNLLLDELEQVTLVRDEIEDEIDAETEGDRNPQRRAQMLRAVSLGNRAATVRELSQTLKNLVPLERQAFGLGNEGTGDPPETERTVVVLPANGRD